MTKNKYYYYVLVITDAGPVFVTDIDNSSKTAMWEMDKPPLELSEYKAEDITMGLNCNMIPAYCIKSKFELDKHPYRYDAFELKFVERSEEDKPNA